MRPIRSGCALESSSRSLPPNECPTQSACSTPSASIVSTRSATCVSRFQGGSYPEWPCPRRSGATTWKRAAQRSSASRRKRSPWAVTPCRHRSGRSEGSPHSCVCRITQLLGLFAVAGGPVVLPALELVRQIVDLEPARVVVRVDVALAVPEPAAVVRAVAQCFRGADVAAFPHVGGCFVDRDVARVRLRRAREIDRRLREVQARFRKPDMLDRLRGG